LSKKWLGGELTAAERSGVWKLFSDRKKSGKDCFVFEKIELIIGNCLGGALKLANHRTVTV